MADKSLLEILVVPLTIAAVGLYATISTTSTQIESAQTLADTQASRSRQNQLEEKDLDITKASLGLIASMEKCDKVLGELTLLVQMATPGHAKKLLPIVKAKCGFSESGNQTLELEQAVENARVNEIQGLISELSGENRRNARTELSSRYLTDPETASTLMARAIEKNQNSYRILLGILVALSNANYNFDQNTELGKALQSIPSASVFQDRTLQSWYKKVTASGA